MISSNSCRTTNCDKSLCFSADQVETFKYLGVCLDRRLSFKSHVESLTLDLRKIVKNLYTLREVCPSEILNNIYYALVFSKLQYGISCWGGTYSSVLKPIEVLQKHIIRIISFKSPRVASLPLFQQRGILPLRYIYVFKVMKLFFVRSGHKSIRRTDYNLRNNRCIVPLPVREQFRRYHLFVAPNIFNKLPLTIKIECNTNKFLYLLKKWLLNQEVNAVENLFAPIGNF